MSNTRGRKQCTLEHKKHMQEWQNTRVKIINLVARKPEIEKTCCICGNPGKILHNRKDPYYITFICDECKKDPNNLILAEEHRFDLREKLDKNNSCTNNFTDEEVTRIIVGFMNDILSIGDYCDKINISRYKFNQLTSRYKEMFPKHNIKKLIKQHSDKIQKEKLKKIAENKTLI